jgi:hypothetical protein
MLLNLSTILIQICVEFIVKTDSLVIPLLHALVGHRVVTQNELVCPEFRPIVQKREIVDRHHANHMSEITVALIPVRAEIPPYEPQR